MAARRARHRRSDERLVASAFEADPRSQQERALLDVRRRMIVGDNADPVLSSCPLDIMWARRIRGAGDLVFGYEHHMAGEWFLRLYRYRNGGCKLKGCLDISQRASSDTNPDNPHRDAEYKALTSDPRLPSESIDMLADVIVFGFMPPWLNAIIFGASVGIPEGQARFMAALDVLRDIWIECGSQSTETLLALYEQRCR